MGFFVIMREGETIKTMTLGEKIRKRRKQLGMTQAALAGDAVTRIMISRLESDDLNPSLHTLLYLAKRLSVPAGYLLTEEDDLHTFLRPGIMEEVRGLFRSGKWQDAVTLCEAYGLHEENCDDECGLLLCECSVRLGRIAYEKGDTVSAAAWFDRALSFAEKTAYHTEVPLGEALLCKAMLADVIGETSTPYLESYMTSVGHEIDIDRYLLLRFLRDIEEGNTAHASRVASVIRIENTLYKTLTAVWLDAANGKTEEARAALGRVLSGEVQTQLHCDPILQYRCIEKMESLSAALDDYKTAYQYATQRERMEKQYHITK